MSSSPLPPPPVPVREDEPSFTILTDDMFRHVPLLSDNPPKELLWNSWQYKLLKKIENGVYNAEVIWCYDEKYGKVGKTTLYKHLISNYKSEKYHKPLRFVGRTIDEVKERLQNVKAIILHLPNYSIDMTCRVHSIDALKDIEEYVNELTDGHSRHPVIIVLSSRKADKVLGLDFDTTFDLICLREIPLPLFTDSLPAEELMHMYTT